MATERANTSAEEPGTLLAIVLGARDAAKLMQANETDAARWTGWGRAIGALERALVALSELYNGPDGGLG